MKTWIAEIERAASEEEILARARDCLSLFSPRELRAISAVPGEIDLRSSEDLPRVTEVFARGLAHARADAPEAADRLDGLVACLSRAAQRLDEIRVRH